MRWWLLILATTTAWAAGTPMGPPATYQGDPIPTPLRTIYVDRCGRGSTSSGAACGTVTCSDTSAAPTSASTPLCHLPAVWSNAQLQGANALRPGDKILVMVGDLTALDKGVYGEQDGHAGAGFNSLASWLPTVKGTSVCASGNTGFECRSDTDCGGGAGSCVYKPIVMQGVRQAGTMTTIDPTFVGDVAATGGSAGCSSSNPGRFAGIYFNNPACQNISNDQKICWSTGNWGAPCTSTATCTGTVFQCASRPWNWIFDTLLFQNWSDYDARTSVTGTNAKCSMNAIQLGSNHGCVNGDLGGQGVTIQNSEFKNNNGGGVINLQVTGCTRVFHNLIHDNHTHAYTTALNDFTSQDNNYGCTSYFWGNQIWNNADDSPAWCTGGNICLPPGSPPAFTCIDGINAGSTCTSEAACAGGHCGNECLYEPAGLGGHQHPTQQGYNCPCAAGDNTQCATGLTCQTISGGDGSCVGMSTEGKGADIDTAANNNSDWRNNVIYNNAGDGFIANSSNKVTFNNNTLWHNAKKGGGGPFTEMQFEGNNLTVYNNLVVPNPNAVGNFATNAGWAPGPFTCHTGTIGGQVCATPGGSCAGGGLCYEANLIQFDSFGSFTINPSTNVIDYNWYWMNFAGQTTTPYGFLYAGNNSQGFLSDYQAYGSGHVPVLTRENHAGVGDPGFKSVTPGDVGTTTFLHFLATSPIAGKGLNTQAPTFDINGTARANPPSPGALEPDSSGTTTTSSTTTTTTSSTTTTTGTGFSGATDDFNRAGPALGANWTGGYLTYGAPVIVGSTQAVATAGAAAVGYWSAGAFSVSTIWACTKLVNTTASGIGGPCLVMAGNDLMCCDLNSAGTLEENWWDNGTLTAGSVSGVPSTDVYVGITRTAANTFTCSTSSGGTWTQRGGAITTANISANGQGGIVTGFSSTTANLGVDAWGTGTGALPATASNCIVTGTSTTTTTTTSGASTTTTTGGPNAPVDWTADSQTVAWWPLDSDYLNHSTATGFCNPPSNGDLMKGSDPNNDISFDTVQKIQGTGSVKHVNGTGQIKQANNTFGLADCLRSAQPSAWTITGWLRSTTITNFYAHIYTSQSQQGGTQTHNLGWVVQWRPLDGTGNLGQCIGGGPPYTGGCVPGPSCDVECDPATFVQLNGVAPTDGNWHFLVTGFNGTSSFLGAGGRAQQAIGPALPGSFPKNNSDNDGYPYEMPHDNGGTYPNMVGNQDAVWWTGRVLTDAQTCRVRSIDPDGALGWCSGNQYASCTTDADCGSRTGSCNHNFDPDGAGPFTGTCVGRLGIVAAGETAPTQCNDVGDLPPCNATLTGVTTTTTTTVPPGMSRKGASLSGTTVR